MVAEVFAAHETINLVLKLLRVTNMLEALQLCLCHSCRWLTALQMTSQNRISILPPVRDTVLSSFSFVLLQVVAEVYAAHDIPAKPQILLSLVLYKIVEPLQVSQLVIVLLLDVAKQVPAEWSACLRCGETTDVPRGL